MRQLIAAAFAAILLAAVPARAEVPTLEGVAVRDHSLEWYGIRLRATRREVERRLKTQLTVATDDDAPACGPFKSSVALSGTTVLIQWSGAGPKATVDSLCFPLAPSEEALGLHQVLRALLARQSELELLSSRIDAPPAIDSALLAVRAHPDEVILLTGAPEHLVFISLEGCLD